MERLLGVPDRDEPLFKRGGKANYNEINSALSPRLAESGGTLSKAEVRVLVGEIKVRLDMIQMAFENLYEE